MQEITRLTTDAAEPQRADPPPAAEKTASSETAGTLWSPASAMSSPATARLSTTRQSSASANGAPQDFTFPPVAPPLAPRTLLETGIPRPILEALLLKALYVQGAADRTALSATLRIAGGIVDELAAPLRLGGSLVESETGRLSLTDVGRCQARDAFAESRYVGSVPVILDDYARQCRRQSLADGTVPVRAVRKSLADLIVDEELIEGVAAALSLGRSLLLHGPRGNGKTQIARRIASLVHDAGGIVFQPRSLLIDRHVCPVFDPAVHRPADAHQAHDPRWIAVRRPIVAWPAAAAGLVPWSLPADGVPLGLPGHIKANGGVLLLDPISAEEAPGIVRRWSLILESRGDLVTLQDGRPVPLPVESLVLMTARPEERERLAGLPVQSQIELPAPSRETLRAVFLKECDRQNLPYREQLFDYLWHGLYTPQSPPRLSDPQDLLITARAISRSREEEGGFLTSDLLRRAARQLGWKVPPATDRVDRRCA